MLLRYRFDSGLEVAQPAAAFVASWHDTLFHCLDGEVEVALSRPLLALRSRISEEPRLRGLEEGTNNFPYTGDAVDQDGLLILPGRPLEVRVSGEQGEVITSFPVPAEGLRVCPGDRIPSGQGGHFTQLLLTTVDGEPLASSFHDGWHDGVRQAYPNGRGFLLCIADAGWFALGDGSFRCDAAAPRLRPSPLA
jgi:hypothetical protein